MVYIKDLSERLVKIVQGASDGQSLTWDTYANIEHDAQGRAADVRYIWCDYSWTR